MVNIAAKNQRNISSYPITFGRATQASPTITINPSHDKEGSSVETSKLNQALKSSILPQTHGYKEISDINAPFFNKGKLYRLNNGQKVILINKPGPTVIKTYVKVGSFNENNQIRGISHFIEHSVFNGSKLLNSGEFVKEINNMGASYNAGTGFSSTNYFVESPLHKEQDMEKIIKMHADMLQNPTFSDEMIKKERGPVISEIHMYEDDPFDKAYNLSLKNLFNFKNSYQGLIAGSEKNIKSLTRNDILDFDNKWYKPENMVTIIVGNEDPNKSIKLLSKYFTKKQPPKNIDNDKHYENLNNPIQKTVRQDVKNPNVNSVLLNMSFAGPKNNNIDETLATLALSSILCGNESSRLTKALKLLNTKPSSDVNVISPNYNDPQVIQFNINFKPSDEEKGLKTVYSTIQELAEQPITNEELEITKNKMKEDFARVNEYAMGITEIIGDAAVEHGDLSYYTNRIELINKLTVQDIQNVAKKYLDLNKTSIIMIHPETVPEDTKNKAKAVSPVKFTGNTKNLDLGKINEYDCQNNIHLVLNNNPNAIQTSAVIQLKTDNMINVKPGVAPILSLIMEKGSKHLSEEKYNDITDRNNLDIKPSIGNDIFSFSADCQASNLPLSLDLIKDIMYNPNFSQEKFEKAKEEAKLLYSSTPESPLSNGLESIYPDSPYGYSPKKNAENIDKVTMNDVVEFYNSIIKNAQGKIVVTAPLDQNPEITQHVFDKASSMPKVQKHEYSNNYNYKPLDKNIVIAKAEERNQAHIVQMYKYKDSGNIKDRAALILMNEILGGNSQSRLFQDLREKKNLAYRVKSYLTTDGKAGEITFEIKTTTKTKQDGKVKTQYENIQKSIDGFNEHVHNMMTKSVTAEELEGAKLSTKSKIILETESSLGKSECLMNGFNTPYGSKQAEDLITEIDKITTEDIKKVASIYLNQPSVVSMIASKDSIENSQNYLKSIGDLKTY